MSARKARTLRCDGTPLMGYYPESRDTALRCIQCGNAPRVAYVRQCEDPRLYVFCRPARRGAYLTTPHRHIRCRCGFGYVLPAVPG